MLDSIFKTILDMTLSSSFLIVAVLIARIILRKSPKIFRKILWGLVALKLIVPFSFESVLSLVPHKSEYMPQSTVVSSEISNAVTNPAFDWKSVLPYVWVVVATLLLIYALFSFIKLKAKMSDAVKYQDNIFQSERVESPFVFGIFKPKIYIPYSIKGEKLDFVLEHEKTHIKYFDHITKLIGFVLLCIHWFNPLVWVSHVLFCKDLELACDEAVVRNMSEGKRKSYALTLCDIGVNKAKITACPIAFGEVSIKERIKATLAYKKVGKIAVYLSLVLCAIVAVCFMTKPVAEAKEKTKETVVEEITVPTTEPNTEPTTEPVTESATDVTEVVTENKADNKVEFGYNEAETTSPVKSGEWIDTACKVMQNGNYDLGKGSSDTPVSYDGKVIVETTKEPETEESWYDKIVKPHNNYNYNNNSNNSSFNNTNNNPYNNPSNDSFVIIWDPAVTNYNPAYQNTPSPYKPGFENNCWVGWDYAHK